jgi:hypothetical protein
LRSRKVANVYRDEGAALVEPLSRGASESTRGAGDDGDASFEIGEFGDGCDEAVPRGEGTNMGLGRKGANRSTMNRCGAYL